MRDVFSINFPVWACLLIGAAFAGAGVAIVEASLILGLGPFGPLGWPGLGAAAAAAFAGGYGFAAAALVVGAYYAGNLAFPERFPLFFASPAPALAWGFGLLMLCGLILALRGLFDRARRLAVLDRALRETEAQFRDFSELSADFFWEQDEEYRFVARISTPNERMPYPLAEVLGKRRWELPALNMTAADWEGHRADLQARREFRDLVIERPLPDGRPRFISSSGRPVFDEAGRFRGYRGVGRDITAQVLAERALRENQAVLRLANERLRLALESSQVALWDTDLRSGEVYLNDAWSRMLGGAPHETRTTTAALLDITHPDDVAAIRSASLAVLKGERDAYSIDHRVRTASGAWLWVRSRGKVVERDAASGRATRIIGTNVDITQLKLDEQAARDMAQRDPLTGAANRTLFHDRLAIALARAKRAGTRLALLYADVDRFKSINDSLGHAAGDALLREFAARLRQCVRGSDTVARIGGDEFALVLENVQSAENAARIAQKLIDLIREPMQLGAGPALVTASIGITLEDGSAHPGRSPEELAAAADAALYGAKRAGRNCWRLAA